MSVSKGQLTSRDVEKNFNDLLDAAITTGSIPGTDTGLDTNVIVSINQVASEYPNVTALSIQNAQQCWRYQVSGAAGAADVAMTERALLARGYSQ